MNPQIPRQDCPYPIPPPSCEDCCHPICKDDHGVNAVVAGCRNENLIGEWFHVNYRVAKEIMRRML